MRVPVNSKRRGTVPFSSDERGTLPLGQSRRRAFTLVELLMVVAIIGILIGLVTAAAIAARLAAKRAAISVEIKQLEAAVEQYKSQYGEYPPDFFGISLSTNPTKDPDLSNAGVRAVVRHLRKAFPRYWGFSASDGATWSNFCGDLQAGYGINANNLDPASALVFWLGGLPEVPGDQPAGFHSDPTRPFQLGSPRKGRFFEFQKERLVMTVQDGPGNTLRYLRYLPPYQETPYVYFRARKEQFAPPSLFGTGRYEYGVVNTGNTTFFPFAYYHATDNVCVPYLDGQEIEAKFGPTDEATLDTACKVPTTKMPPYPPRYWRQAEKFQIISAGLDNLFSSSPYPFRATRTGIAFRLEDMDNQTSFAPGKLEDEMQ